MATPCASANVKSGASLRPEADAVAADVFKDDEQPVNRLPASAVTTNVLREVDRGMLKLLTQDSSLDAIAESRFLFFRANSIDDPVGQLWRRYLAVQRGAHPLFSLLSDSQHP